MDELPEFGASLIEVPRVPFEKLAADRRGEPSEDVRQRAEAARGIQAERFKETCLYCNAEMGPSEVKAICTLDATGKKLMKSAMRQMLCKRRLPSTRAFHRILKLARTIADQE